MTGIFNCSESMRKVKLRYYLYNTESTTNERDYQTVESTHSTFSTHKLPKIISSSTPKPSTSMLGHIVRPPVQFKT